MGELEALRERLYSFAAQQPNGAQIVQKELDHKGRAVREPHGFVGYVMGGAAIAGELLDKAGAKPTTFEVTGEGIKPRRVGGYILRERYKYDCRRAPYSDMFDLPRAYRSWHVRKISQLVVLRGTGNLVLASNSNGRRIVDRKPSPSTWFREEGIISQADSRALMVEAETDMKNMLTTYIATS